MTRTDEMSLSDKRSQIRNMFRDLREQGSPGIPEKKKRKKRLEEEEPENGLDSFMGSLGEEEPIDFKKNQEKLSKLINSRLSRPK